MRKPESTPGVWDISEERPLAYKTFGTKEGIRVTLSVMEVSRSEPADSRWGWQAITSHEAGQSRIATGEADAPEAAMRAAEARWPELLIEQKEEKEREERRKAEQEQRKAAQIEIMLAAIAAVNSEAAETEPAG